MAENNKCNAEQYEEVSKHISALLWLNDNGGWESVGKRLMPEGYRWPCFEDGSPVMIGDEFVDGIGMVDRIRYVSFDHDYFTLEGDNGSTTYQFGNCVGRPKIDTQEKIDADEALHPDHYCLKHGLECNGSHIKGTVKYKHLFMRQRKLCMVNDDI